PRCAAAALGLCSKQPAIPCQRREYREAADGAGPDGLGRSKRLKDGKAGVRPGGAYANRHAATSRARTWQATPWPGETLVIAGIEAAQTVSAIEQRVRNGQPEGGSIGLGTSPFSTIRSRLRNAGSAIGTADRSARV